MKKVTLKKSLIAASDQDRWVPRTAEDRRLHRPWGQRRSGGQDPGSRSPCHGRDRQRL